MSNGKKTFVVMDPHGEYRDLLLFFKPDELVWMTAEDLGLNPFEVPRDAAGRRVMDPRRWLGVVREWLRGTWLNEPSLNLLMAVVTRLYQERGIFEGSEDYPSLTEVIDAVAKVVAQRGSDQARAREKVLDRLCAIRSLLPGLDVRKSRDVHDLFGKRSVILDLVETRDTALPLLFNLLVQIFTASFYHEPGDPITRLLVMDEAHLFLGGQFDRRTSDIGETAGTSVLRSVRKAGFFGVVVNQMVSDLAPAVLGNLSSVICMRLPRRDCVSRIASTLGLKKWQEAKLSSLPTREAIVRLCRYPEPIHMQVKELNDA